MVYIYVLKLENNKYYIGKTDNPNIRLNAHFNCNGSEWTKKYNPLEIIDIIPDCDKYDEDKYTKIYMDKYGIDNVRGGSYVKLELDTDTIKFLQKESIATNDKCFNCGMNGHFSKDCNKNKNNNYEDPLELVSLNSLIKNSPQSILQKISILDNINKLKNYKIKSGDIILNHYKNNYTNLQEIIDDAIYIYDNHENNLDINISFKQDRINFYKNFSQLLATLPCEIIKELFENKKTFQEIEMEIIKNLM
jgi:GIY-YIG catalytic domain/Zinc knuckle